MRELHTSDGKTATQTRLRAVNENAARISALLAVTGSRNVWWPANLHWRRIYGRYYPQTNNDITMLYRAACNGRHLCSVDLFARHPKTHTDAQVLIEDETLGWVGLRAFPDDKALPTLRDLLRQEPDMDVVRYRPGRRCTLQTADKQRYAKVFADQKGATIHSQSIALWQAGEAGALQFEVAQPLRWDTATCTLWQHTIRGQAVKPELFDSRAAQTATQMGGACASITQASLRPDEVFDYSVQARRTDRYLKTLALQLPDRKPQLERLQQGLHKAAQSTQPAELRPIHGAPHMHQWLRTSNEGIGLVDFDRFAMGEPELDVATFIAEMDYENETEVPVATINRNFVRAYEQVAGPLRPERVQLYRAHKHIAKAVKAATALRADNELRAIKRLQRANELLEGVAA